MEPELQLAGENSKSEEFIEGSEKSPAKPAKTGGSFLQLNDAADEFFDVLDESEYEQTEAMWPSDAGMQSQVTLLPLALEYVQ